jgi:gamma-glutamyltranspeptidase / glutathione hydrolase
MKSVSMKQTSTRREFLQFSGKAALAGALAPHVSIAGDAPKTGTRGALSGDMIAAKAGEKILAAGGNAIDAAIATAFAACICSPSKCGIGGYGGHAMIALAGGKKIAAIDFNSTAPAAARADMFPLEPNGKVKGNVNIHGWLAAGVPGTVAGLELALARYGSRTLRDVLAPAIQMCEEGVYVAAVKGIDDASHNDPRPEAEQGSKLPPEKRRNVALGKLLKTLAQRNSADSFYRGDIADTIAAAFQKNGGLVTKKDLVAYRARELTPLRVDWNGMAMHTVPLTSTGLLLLEASAALKALNWSKLSAEERLHAKVEALRIAWADRLRYFGDPEHVSVPAEKLISANYAGELAEKISVALKTQKPVPLQVDPSRAGGTTNISAVDAHGNMIAITLTHGGGYGAHVSVDELGMVLGHGMSRFDPRPGLPNSPGPGKRPITNMCPTVVTRDGLPVLAIGGAGGTRIPNSIYEVLLNYVGLGTSMEAALAAQRIDANGTLEIGFEKNRVEADEALMKSIGYGTRTFVAAFVSGATFDPKTGEMRAKAR